jgi:tetratricopeptide (TPR) repeat protein
MDPRNPVVRLCGEGMQAEAERRPRAAHALFLAAWNERRDDYDACIAAHFVARAQESPEDALAWNQLALRHAEAARDERVRPFFASLYLNLGFAREMLGQLAEAVSDYAAAGAWLPEVPEGPYREVVRGGIERARERTAGHPAG